MALPEIELECSDGPRRPGCGRRWTTTAAAGSTIKCPGCGKGARVPADRPRTPAAARAAADHGADSLAAAWEAEAPPAAWPDCLGAEGGQDCPDCGQPMHWTGAHTALACPGCRAWSVSAGARDRAAEHVAAIDKSAARKSAQLADPEAERAAAEALAAERAELLDDLAGAAELLDVTSFPRREPWLAARLAGIRHGATVQHYTDRARRADRLDQLARVRDDAWRFLLSIEPWAARIDQLRDDLDQAPPPRQVIRGAVERDDGPRRVPLRPDQRRELHALMPGARAPEPTGSPAVAELHGPWCQRCRAEQRRGPDGRYFPAAARIEHPGRPFEDVCADHLADAQTRSGSGLHISERHDQQAVYAATAGPPPAPPSVGQQMRAALARAFEPRS